MGTPEFAVPTLSELITNGYNVTAVVTQPDKKRGRGKTVSFSPVKEVAISNSIEVLQPQSLKRNSKFFTEEDEKILIRLRELSPDIIVVVAYGKILPKEVLDLPPLGCINVHASILPHYRGAAPINFAILNGDNKTGVTTMLMDEGMDTGDILLVEELPIEDNDTTLTLGNKLSDVGGKLLIKTIEGLVSGEVNPTKQVDSDATYAKLFTKEDGLMDWSMTAKELNCFVRGMTPWPSAYTFIGGKKLKVLETVLTEEKSDKENGEIVSVDGSIDVVAGGSILKITTLQAEGKKPMASADYLRGAKLNRGDKFTNE